MWRLRYSSSAIDEDIPRLGATAKVRVRKAIESKLATDPMRFGKPLRHSLHYLRSLRAGDTRVLYRVDPGEQLVSIAAIGHRRDIYQA